MSQKVPAVSQTHLVETTDEVPEDEQKLPKKVKLELSENALRVIEKRYLIKDRSLKPLETPEKMFERVASHIAKVDVFYDATKEEIAKTTEEFYNAMVKLEFLPNSPTFTGAGTKLGQLAACFVLPIEDDMKGILKTQMDMGLIHKSGGGTGFSFSHLRPKNDVVGTTGGVSSGPIGFLQMYNDTTECIKQGGTRRGANMGILRVDHPDILDFISYKEKEGTLANFNISVALTREFMKALQKDEEYDLVNPHNKKTVKKIKAREVFDKIIEGAWRNGEPGIIFLDKINEKNPTPKVGEIEATNPCVIGDTLVSTERGLKKIKDLAADEIDHRILTDEVVFGYLKPDSFHHGPIGLLGKTERKLSLNKSTRIFKTGTKKVYRITTKSGYELELTADHKVYTTDGWVAVKNLKIGYNEVYLQPQKGFFNKNYKLPFGVKNKIIGQNGRKYILNLPDSWSEKLGEIMGLIVGDGWLIRNGKNCRLGLTFGQKDQDVLKYAQKIVNGYYLKNIQAVKRKNNVWHLSYHSRFLVEFFFALGITDKKAAEKRVPENIFQAPEEAVRGFLRGLFSADGTISWQEMNNCRAIRLTSKSLKLLKDVQLLLLNLGIKAQIYDRSRLARTGFSYTTKAGTKKEYLLDGQLYEIHIARQSLKRFLKEIGFLNQKYQEISQNLLKANFYEEKFKETIIKIENVGLKEVYDLTEPYTQSFIANGIIVSNCGEQPLLPYESCNLGAINLKKFVKTSGDKKEIDWEKLDQTISTVVHFMDNVIDINKYPIPEIEKMTKLNRKIGITIMGFANMLYMIGVPYDSEEGLKTAEKIMGFIEKRSHEESAKLAEKRGEFPNFKESIWDKKNAPKMRNSATTSCNPTGTLSIIGTCSSGIEPFFALAYTKTVMDGTALPEINEHFLEIAKKRGFYSDELLKEILEKGSIQEIESIPADVRNVFKVSGDIKPKWHVKMQAAFQKHTDGAISKTINFPNSATREEVEEAYLLAYKLDCKGLTVYRDGSRNVQVLTTGASDKKTENEPQTIEATAATKITPRERPDVIRGYTYRIKTAYGKLFITINDDEYGQPFEVFSHLGKAGGFFAAKAEAICRLISLSLRSGIAAEEVIDQLKGIRGPTPTWSEDGKMILSLPDAVAQVLEKHISKSQSSLDLEYKTGEQSTLEKVDLETAEAMLSNGFSKKEAASKPLSLADLGEAPACPECGAMLEISEGCLKCNLCGFSKCG